MTTQDITHETDDSYDDQPAPSVSELFLTQKDPATVALGLAQNQFEAIRNNPHFQNDASMVYVILSKQGWAIDYVNQDFIKDSIATRLALENVRGTIRVNHENNYMPYGGYKLTRHAFINYAIKHALELDDMSWPAVREALLANRLQIHTLEDAERAVSGQMTPLPGGNDLMSLFNLFK